MPSQRQDRKREKTRAPARTPLIQVFYLPEGTNLPRSVVVWRNGNSFEVEELLSGSGPDGHRIDVNALGTPTIPPHADPEDAKELLDFWGSGKSVASKFDRLVIVEQRTRALLVLDVIPDGTAEVLVDNSGRKRELILTGYVRSILTKQNRLLLKLRFKIDTSRPVHGFNDLYLKVAGASDTGKLKLDGDGLNKFLSKDAEAEKFKLKPGDFSADFLKTLGISFKEEGEERELRAFAVEEFFDQKDHMLPGVCIQNPAPTSPEGEVRACAYGIAFRGDGQEPNNHVNRIIPLFPAKHEADGFLRLEFEGRERNWQVTQYPASDLGPFPKRNAAPKPMSRFVVTLKGVASTPVFDVWNRYVKKYHDAIRTVLDGRPVSFAPFVSGGERETRWTVAYRFDDQATEQKVCFTIPGANFLPEKRETVAAAGALGVSDQCKHGHPSAPSATHILTVASGLSAPEGSTVDFEFERIRTHINGILKGTAETSHRDLWREVDPLRSIQIDLRTAIRPANSQHVRMGSLDLEFGHSDALEATGRLTLEPADTYPGFNADADIALAAIRPGGQDALPGEEYVPEGGAGAIQNVDVEGACTTNPEPGTDDYDRCVESGFRRKNPLLIDLDSARISNNANPNVDLYLLHVDEVTQRGSHQTIRLNIRNQAGSVSAGPLGDKPMRAVVIDRNPFLVAQVEYLPFNKQYAAKDATIALWSNVGLESAAWQLQKTTENPVVLALPSQGIGEEMERGYPNEDLAGNKYTIKEGDPVDFRLSPPTEIAIDIIDQDRNFVEAPWNLRRILSAERAGQTGVRIRHLQFELLYGLTFDVENPLARLAEISALIGSVPGRLGIEPRWHLHKTDQDKLAYQKLRLRWSQHYRRLLSRLAILEPWDAYLQGSLIMSTGVKSVIRMVETKEDGETVMPADLAHPADADAAKQSGLKGGVTWGIQSKNIYNAVVDAPDGKNPASTSATVSDLAFSALGGWGHTEAAFDKNRSKFYGDVAQGRTYCYRVERIGRLGCFWNRMKHVIVYERTVVPSDQFADSQPPHAGLPIDRKVREFITPLDHERHYPDGLGADSAELKKLEKRRGFVAACTFEKGTEIPVDSEWGTDVGTIGWKIPLWNATANPRIYPKPDKVQIHLDCDTGGTTQAIPCICDEPQNVYFYTDTRPETSGDPNEWPAIEGVDLVDMPRPRPLPDFAGGNPNQTTPDDPPVAPGYGPCTFKLRPIALPTDLASNRADKPLAAILETVTIMRATYAEGAKSLTTPEGMFENVFNARDEVARTVSELYRMIPRTGAVPQSVVADIKKRGEVLAADITAAASKMNAACGALNQAAQKLEGRVRAREAEILIRIERDFTEIVAAVRTGLLAELDLITDSDPAVIKRKALDTIDRLINLFRDRFQLLRLSDGILRTTIKEKAVLAVEMLGILTTRLQQLANFVDTLPNTIPNPLVHELRRHANEFFDAVNRSLDNIERSVSARLEPWLPDLGPAIIDKYLSRDAHPNPHINLRTEIDDIRRAFLALVPADLLGTVPKSDITPQITQLQTLAAQLGPLVTAFANIQTPNYIHGWHARFLDDVLAPLLNALRAPVVQQGGPNLAQLRDAINALLGEAPTPNTLNVFVEFRAARDDATDFVSTHIGFVGKLADRVCQHVFTADRFRSFIKDLRVNDVVQRLDDYMAETLGHINDFVDSGGSLLRSIPGALEPAFVAGTDSLGLIRAFGKAPEVPNLDFARKKLAYYYKDALDAVDVTPVLSRAKESVESLGLGPVGINLPAKALANKLIPPDLRNFNLSKILAECAGFDCSNLLPAVKLPNDNLHISHGADPQTRRAWVAIDVDFKLPEPATLFALGPVMVRLRGAHFEAHVRIEGGIGDTPKRTVTGSITADWEMTIAGSTVVIFRDTKVSFNGDGGLKFDLDPRKVELPGVMKFIQEFLAKFAGPDSGLSIGITPTGVRAMLSLPIPDTQVGVSGISNLRLIGLLQLSFISGNFEIMVGFGLARREAPFSLTIFILGGGGYLELEARYVPATGMIKAVVRVGIVASASLAIALGPIKGGVYVYFGITAEFESGAGGGLTIGIMLLFRGHVSILGLAEASISLLLEAKYGGGKLIGRGQLTISIKICWCFTLEIDQEVTYEFGGGGNGAMPLAPELRGLLAANARPYSDPLYVPTDKPALNPACELDEKIAGWYIGLFDEDP